MDNLFEIASRVSTPIGLAGITIAALFFVFREILKKDIFPTLTKNLSSDIIRLLIHRLFVLALVSMVLGFAGFALTILHGQNPDPENEVLYKGQVVNGKGDPISNAEVQIRDEKGNIQAVRTDSVGNYVYRIKEATKSAHFKVTAEKYEPYERDVPPGQSVAEPFMLKEKPTPPVAVPINRPQASPGPTCSPVDRARGKC